MSLSETTKLTRVTAMMLLMGRCAVAPWLEHLTIKLEELCLSPVLPNRPRGKFVHPTLP